MEFCTLLFMKQTSILIYLSYHDVQRENKMSRRIFWLRLAELCDQQGTKTNNQEPSFRS